MDLHIDCSACPGAPAACEGCAVGFLLGPVVSLAGNGEPTKVEGAAATASRTAAERRAELGIAEAVAAFAGAGMLPGTELAAEQRLRAV